MNIKRGATFTATISVGLREGFDGPVHGADEARAICQNYANANNLFVSFRLVDFIYPNGAEPGVEVGLFNYPRFPQPIKTIRSHAVALATALMLAFKQVRATVIFTDETLMLEMPDVTRD